MKKETYKRIGIEMALAVVMLMTMAMGGQAGAVTSIVSGQGNTPADGAYHVQAQWCTAGAVNGCTDANGLPSLAWQPDAVLSAYTTGADAILDAWCKSKNTVTASGVNWKIISTTSTVDFSKIELPPNYPGVGMPLCDGPTAQYLNAGTVPTSRLCWSETAQKHRLIGCFYDTAAATSQQGDFIGWCY